MHALHHHNCLSIHRCSIDIVARCRTIVFAGVLGVALAPASLLAQDSPQLQVTVLKLTWRFRRQMAH